MFNFKYYLWGMILPQKLTSKTFYSFTHGHGITFNIEKYGIVWALHPPPPHFATDFRLHPTCNFFFGGGEGPLIVRAVEKKLIIKC